MVAETPANVNQYARTGTQERETGVDRALKIFAYVVLILITVVTVGPFYFSVVLSLLPQPETVRLSLSSLLPSTSWQFDAFRTVFNSSDLPRWFFNSVVVAFVWVVARCLFDTMAGYAFARMSFPGKEIAFLSLLSTLMIPGMVTLIPRFIILDNFHLLDTYGALTIPFLADVFGIFLMRQFFANFPLDLEDAARIDGASRYRMFFQIALPNAGAGLVSLIIFSFQASWNSFLEPLIFISSANLRTLPIGLAFFKQQNVSNYPVQMAVAVISTIPIALVFFVFQRYYLQSQTSSGIKG